MRYSDRGLDNPINWSFQIGRLFDINIRIHIVFVLFAIILLIKFAREASETLPFSTVIVHAFGTYAILFLVVLLHEFGHCYGARRTGGEADEILIWPLGGLASTRPPHHPTAHLVTTLAGPAVNVVICVAVGLILVAWTGRIGAVPLNPLHPFTPSDPAVSLYASSAQMWFIRVFGVSYLLLLFNLLPIFPFDGGRILQSYLWARKDYVTSMEIATFTGMVGAILLALFGLIVDQSWILLMIAVFGYITCWQTRRMVREYGDPGAGEFGYDFSRGYQAFDEYESRPRRMGWLKRRRLRRAAMQEERERQRERQRHKQVEEILRKVAQSGLESLSPTERRLLEAETARRRALSGDGSDI